ncbi:MAG: ATP-dependent Clp protease ATP-binding subunit [Armatimonadetes bacterium]|nr:ATP-dependent Clp protease ATP-binding subunit [Armatimonadota bacterium]
MPPLLFEIAGLVHRLEDGCFLAEALRFPEMARYAATAERALKNLERSLTPFLEELPLHELHTRRAPAALRSLEVELELLPPSGTLYWREPFPLRFWAVRWESSAAHHAYIPALGIEVLGESAGELEELLLPQIQAELRRRDSTGSLSSLARYRAYRGLELVRRSFTIDLKTPRQRAEELQGESPEDSVLERVATDLCATPLPAAYEMEGLLSRLADPLTGATARSVLLVGPSGVGKTALCYALVRRRSQFQLRSTPFYETTGSRLMVGTEGFGDWQERCRQVWEEAARRRAVLLLGSLVELAEVGRSCSSPQGMAGFFRPYLSRGDLVAVVECTPEQVDLLERREPHLVESFVQLRVDPPDRSRGEAILLGCATEDPRQPSIDLEAIELIDRLHRRYATYSAYPGRPLRFLRNLLSDKGQTRIGTADVAAAFCEESGLPLFLVDEEQPMDLEQTHRFFTERITGQPEAVELVVDLMATVKAGLIPWGRPIASLLFIGPTGVGKTEMARSLAEFLFRDRKRLVRLDMSEYADPVSVQRLVGGQEGGQGVLTARVREQPFGVVLFDELEKADPSFFDLLLQILGEGRLTDEVGRLADFSNHLIVMTSNLGAQAFQRGPLGFVTDREGADHARREFTRAVKEAFRPELFNRLDRVVPFGPLGPAAIGRIAERELELIRRREGLRYRDLELRIEPGVASFLAESGFDRRYGARPLKRAVADSLLVNLGDALNRYDSRTPLEAEVRLHEGAVRVQVRRARQTAERDLGEESARAREALRLRRLCQATLWGPAVLELKNEVYQLNRLAERLSRRKRPPGAEESRWLSELPHRVGLAQRLEDLGSRCESLELQALSSLHGHAAPVEDSSSDLAAELDRLHLELYALAFEDPHQLTVIVYAEKGAPLDLLQGTYLELANRWGYETQLYEMRLVRTRASRVEEILMPLDAERMLAFTPVEGLAASPSGLLGYTLTLLGEMSGPRFSGEEGLHVFVEENRTTRCHVQTSERLREYRPPQDIHLRKSLAGPPKRRSYLRNERLVEEFPEGGRHVWTGKELASLLEGLLTARMQAEARRACGVDVTEC